MRIGIILHPYGEDQPAGLSRTIFELTKSMISMDQKNEYVIFLKRKPRCLPEFPGKNWSVYVLGEGLLWLDGLRRAPLCDVIIFNTPVLPLFYKPKNSVVLALDFAYYYFPPKGFRATVMNKLTFWYHGRSLSRADAIVAISEATKKDVIKLFRIAPERVRVVRCGFKNICAVSEQAMTLPEKFFLFVGVMKPRKNVFNVVKAFRAICSLYPDYSLVLGGRAEGVYTDEMRHFINKEGISGRVHFIGHLNDGQLSYIYRRAQALVFASFIEGFGYPVLEAMACGTPVITSKFSSLGEICQNSSAILVDPVSIQELASAMEQIVRDKGLTEKLIHNGQLQAAQFSWEKAGKEMLKALRLI
ncbi:MAG: glycosyltransferase family 1 protein [Patescibacteria group bacterium]